MPDYRWPTTLDSVEDLLAVTGSFWADTYAGNALVGSLLYAKAQQQAQAQLDLLELLASMSRLNVPVFHKENWSLLVLTESELNSPNLPVFDGTYAWDGTIAFDTPVSTPLFAWPAPPGLVDARVIMDRITGATLTCTAGADFFVTPGTVWFRDNPFDNPGVLVEDVFEGGVAVDRRAYLWAYRGEYDWDTVYRQFGYVLGLKVASGRPYKDMVNAVYDGLVEGTSARCVEDFMSAVCDVPLARADETVRHVLSDDKKQWVVTDANVYGFSKSATVTVASGDAVRAGDPLCDALTFHDTNRGTTPDDVRALTLGRGLLSAAYFRELTFENKEVPLAVTPDVDGYTKVEFEVGGWPADVEAFWADTHAAGVAAGDTLAMRLDTRTNKVGQPTAVSLPTTVNPLKFLFENVLRGNFFLVVVRPDGFGPEAVGLHAARVLRRLVPPQTACVLLVQWAAGETVTMDGPGDEAAPGYDEDVVSYSAAAISETVDPADYVDERVRVYQVGGHCK